MPALLSTTIFIMNSRSVSTKTCIVLALAKEVPVTNLRINTVCNFQTMKLCLVHIQEKSNANTMLNSTFQECLGRANGSGEFIRAFREPKIENFLNNLMIVSKQKVTLTQKRFHLGSYRITCINGPLSQASLLHAYVNERERIYLILLSPL